MTSRSRWPWKRSSRAEDGASIDANVPASTSQSVPGLNNAPYGLEVVSEGLDPVVDIVAVHGLNGHRQTSWAAANGVHWLRDLLPNDLPNARIMCWGYDANTHPNSRVSCQYLYDHARTLVSDLCRKRRLTGSTKRPIIFIAHSLGGIIVKSALIHSDTSRQGSLVEHRSIRLSTYGIMFMGTPHQGGSGVQLARLLVNVASLFVAADDRLLQHLERDSEWLQQQLGQYSPISGDFVTKFAYEEYKTPTALGYEIMVVPRASAVVPGQADAEPIVIHADHVTMVRYLSKDDTGYKTISEHLQIMVIDINGSIQSRWETEARINEARCVLSLNQYLLPFSLADVTGVNKFVARTEELAHLHEILGEAEGRRTAVLHGLGGMGKTQLAVAYMKGHRGDFSAAIWMNAKDETTLKQSFGRIAERISRQCPSLVYFQNALKDRDLDQTVQAVIRWLDEPKNDNWLLVYDNYDDPKLGSQRNEPLEAGMTELSIAEKNSTVKAYDIRQYFPSTEHGSILVTTRSSIVNIGQPIHLGKLKDVQDSLDILVSTSERKDLYNDNAAKQLAEKLDGLPLALSTAGAYLNQVTTSCEEYLQIYERSWLRLQKSSPQLLSYENRVMYSTWNISYAYITRDNSDAAKLLRLWAYFDSNDVWYELLQSGSHDTNKSHSSSWLRDVTEDRLRFDEALRVLCCHGLAQVDPPSKEFSTQPRGYSVHVCVHSWMKHVLNSEVNMDLLLLAMRCVAWHIPYEQEIEFSCVQRRLVRHADRCVQMMTIKERLFESEEEAWIPHNLGRLYTDQGRLSDAKAMYEQALRVKEKLHGPDHLSTLDSITNLGYVHQSLGSLTAAKTMYERAMQGYEKTLGPHHISTVSIINNLGSLSIDQGQLSNAACLYLQVLQALGVEGEVSRSHHRLLLDTANNLGTLYTRQGRLHEAETFLEWALGGKEEALGPDHTSTLSTVNNLGLLYSKQPQLHKAEAMFKRVFEGYKEIWGPSHTLTLSTLHNLAGLYVKQGRMKVAEFIYKLVLDGYEKALGSNHIVSFSTVNGLGILYARQGRLRDAECMFKQALQGYSKALGDSHSETHPPVLDALENLGNVLSLLDRADEARQYFTRAEQGICLVYGTESERYQTICSSIQRF